MTIECADQLSSKTQSGWDEYESVKKNEKKIFMFPRQIEGRSARFARV